MDKDKKDKPAGGAGIEALLIFWFVVIMMLFGAASYFDIANLRASVNEILHTILFYLVNFFAKYFVFSIFFSIAMMIFVSIYSYRYELIRKKVMEKIESTDVEDTSGGAPKEVNPGWRHIEENIATDDPNKWKMAILEADVILGELLEKMNLPGDNIGEKLKAVEKSDFPFLDDAWEVHKIRNSIAHAGSDFQISERDAKRTIATFQKIFSDYDII